MRRALAFLFAFAALTLQAAKKPPAESVLWKDGTALCSVGRAADSHECVAYAATELQRALERCSGASFEILDGFSSEEPTIFIGHAGDGVFRQHADKLGLRPGEDDQVVVRCLKGKHVVIVGNTPGAALRGTYAFIRKHLGVRYLWSGEGGTFYPKTPTRTLSTALDERYEPKIRWRGYHLCGDWYKADEFIAWMPCNGLNVFCHPHANRRKHLGLKTTGGGHILALSDDALFEENPDWFALVNGKREKCTLCFTERGSVKTVVDKIAATPGLGTDEIVYHNMFAADVGEKCECSTCKANDYSTNVFRYHQWVTEALRRLYPAQRFSTLAYSGYLNPPNFKMKLIDQVQIATHNKCNHHAVDDPNCPWNRALVQLYERWRDYGAKHYGGQLPLGEYGYDFEVYIAKGKTMFVPNFSLLEDSLRVSRRFRHHLVIPEGPIHPKGVDAREVISVQNRLPMAYCAQAMWDETLTAEAFIDDTARTIWGPGGAAMAAYLKLLDKAWRSTKRCVLMLKDPIDDAGAFLTPEVERAALAKLDEAEKAIGEAASDARFPAFDGERARAALADERYQLERWRSFARIVRGETGRPKAGVPMAVWIGCPSREKGDVHKIEDRLANLGFAATVTCDEKVFKRALRDAKVIWMRHPSIREDTLQDGVWKTIKRKVRGDGALLACSSHWPIPIDAKLGDPSLALKWVRIDMMDAFKRKFTTLADGDWSRKPHDFSARITNGLAGGYTYDPIQRDKWKILAFEKNLDGQPDVPSIMMREWGKGRILVFGLSISLPECELVANIAAPRP